MQQKRLISVDSAPVQSAAREVCKMLPSKCRCMGYEMWSTNETSALWECAGVGMLFRQTVRRRWVPWTHYIQAPGCPRLRQITAAPAARVAPYKMVHLLFFFCADWAGRGLRTALEAVSSVWGLGLECAPNGLVEDALQVALCQCRALEVLLRLDFLGNHNGLLVLDGRHLLLAQRLLGGLVVSQIELGADQDDGHARCVVVNLGIPLGSLVWGRRGWMGGRAFALTLSKEGGLTMEKQMRKTSVWGYDSGRSLS